MAAHKVLVALDESATAFRALKFALGRAAAAKDEVWALSVLDTRRVLVDARESARKDKEASGYAERLQRVLDEAKGFAGGLGVKLQTEMRPSDDPAALIVAFARSGSFGEIVLGHREKKGVERMVLGSTALRVLELTEIPVTIVR